MFHVVVGRGASVTALGDELDRLRRVLRILDEEDFHRPTNCPPWNLGELVVHIGDSIRLAAPHPPAPPGSRLATAADYYRRPERATDAYRHSNVRRMQRLASEVLASTSATEWLDGVAADTLGTLRAEDPDAAVAIPRMGRPMRLDDWVATRVISVAIHGLDVAITLGRESWTADSAGHVTGEVLVDLLGGEPPPALGWGSEDLLLAGTGRRPLTGAERVALGAAAQRFPLLS